MPEYDDTDTIELPAPVPAKPWSTAELIQYALKSSRTVAAAA